MRALPRHARTASRRRPALWMTGGALGAALTTALVLAAPTPGTLALWNQGAEVPGATITVAGVDLSVAAGEEAAPQGQATATFPAETWATLLPGDVVGSTFTVTSHRDGAVQLSAALDAHAASHPDVTFVLSEGACHGSEPTGTVLTASPAELAGPALTTGVAAAFCLQVALSATTPAESQGTQLIPAFALTLTGTQDTA